MKEFELIRVCHFFIVKILSFQSETLSSFSFSVGISTTVFRFSFITKKFSFLASPLPLLCLAVQGTSHPFSLFYGIFAPSFALFAPYGRFAPFVSSYSRPTGASFYRLLRITEVAELIFPLHYFAPLSFFFSRTENDKKLKNLVFGRTFSGNPHWPLARPKKAITQKFRSFILPLAFFFLPTPSFILPTCPFFSREDRMIKIRNFYFITSS